MSLDKDAPGKTPAVKGIDFCFLYPPVIVSHGACDFIDVNSRLVTVDGYIRCLVLW